MMTSKGLLSSHLDKGVIKKLLYRELLKQSKLVEAVTGFEKSKAKTNEHAVCLCL